MSMNTIMNVNNSSMNNIRNMNKVLITLIIMLIFILMSMNYIIMTNNMNNCIMAINNHKHEY